MHEPEHSRVSRVVGSRIREIRRESGISQNDLAELSDLHPTTYGKIERGTSNPQLDSLARIATALGTSISDLVRDVTPDLVQPRKILRLTVKDLKEERARLDRENEKRQRGA